MRESKESRTSPAISRRAKSLVLLAGLVGIIGCAGPKNLVDVDTTVPVESVPDVSMHKIYIATSRTPSDDPGEFFSGERGEGLRFASVEVSIPRNRQPGTISIPSRPPADPEKHFVIDDPALFRERAEFRSDLTAYLRGLPADRRDVILYVHGYNTNTTAAILQIAQFVEDTGYKGVPILFTWASSANTLKYVYDMNSALVARDHLVSMFETMNIPAVKGYDVVAHSMGTFLVMEASRQIVLTTGLNPTGKVKNVILAAPDIDIDLFKAQIKLIPENQRNIVVLVSSDDKALRASKRVAGGISRVGQTPIEELASLGVIAVDLSAVDDTDSLSHAKFKNSPEVVQLIGNSMKSRQSFNQRPSLGFGKALAVTVEGTVGVVTPSLD
ncbi:alpha/beta hydrolase [Defluviimonas sp. D31]|uniref:alpha/beta hydrolase n=1 Tax=Defluviimonas sp. D31 TaxID=3083253 RepID=UPI00296E7FB0|nr:alpha/beta hydrolase [Defluviimonas sp. D31]MDW4551723.1 alpha/beta hydrolase [Defluviimonas sp. D31]